MAETKHASMLRYEQKEENAVNVEIHKEFIQ